MKLGILFFSVDTKSFQSRVRGMGNTHKTTLRIMFDLGHNL